FAELQAPRGAALAPEGERRWKQALERGEAKLLAAQTLLAEAGTSRRAWTGELRTYVGALEDDGAQALSPATRRLWTGLLACAISVKASLVQGALVAPVRRHVPGAVPRVAQPPVAALDHETQEELARLAMLAPAVDAALAKVRAARALRYDLLAVSDLTEPL